MTQGFQCDGCGKFASQQSADRLPVGWLSLTHERKAGLVEGDYCSVDCIQRYLDGSLESKAQEPEPKERRFRAP